MSSMKSSDIARDAKEVEEEIQNISGGEDKQMTENQNKRKRHSPQQIQAMEGFFKGCPLPDRNQINELGQELEMEPLQVRYWFQNKRTQMKSKHQTQENRRLMIQNEKLKADNTRYSEALSKSCCSNCGNMVTNGNVLLDEQRLMVENARLREEIELMSALVANSSVKHFMESTSK